VRGRRLLEGSRKLTARFVTLAELRHDHAERDEDLRPRVVVAVPATALFEGFCELSLGVPERSGRVVVLHRLLDGREDGDVVIASLRGSGAGERKREHHESGANSP
jgi:hypothetical protein